jgi:hypothetical protein
MVNPASISLLISYRMASHMSGVYLLSFCFISLNNVSIPNLCSITSLGIPDISNIFLFGIELWADLELLLRIGVIGQNFLVVLILYCPLLLVVHLWISGWLGRG